MKFSPPRAKQNLAALHPWSESCRDSQTSLHDESTDITAGDELLGNQLLPCRTGSLCASTSRLCGEVSTRGLESPSNSFLVCLSSLSLPAASRHAPIAPDCLIGKFQVRGPDKPGQSAQTVIHLFGAAGVAALFLCTSPRGISAGAGVI